MSPPKVAVITGAGRGIGAATAKLFSHNGYAVCINYKSDEKSANQLAKSISDEGGQCITVQADVSCESDVERLFATVDKTLGTVTVLVNNAGILRDKSFTKGSLDDFKLVLDVHLMGSVNCTKACWDIMRDQAYGRIVVTTSSSGLYGNFGQTNYGSAKMGVIGMMNTLAQEGAKYDIRINALAPTAGTRMTEGLIPEEAFALLTPETVTPAVLYMASDDAPNKTIICACLLYTSPSPRD